MQAATAKENREEVWRLEFIGLSGAWCWEVGGLFGPDISKCALPPAPDKALRSQWICGFKCFYCMGLGGRFEFGLRRVIGVLLLERRGGAAEWEGRSRSTTEPLGPLGGARRSPARGTRSPVEGAPTSQQTLRLGECPTLSKVGRLSVGPGAAARRRRVPMPGRLVRPGP